MRCAEHAPNRMARISTLKRRPEASPVSQTSPPPVPPNLSIIDQLRGPEAQLGASTPNSLAYSAFNRCQPPNCRASAPTIRPTG